MKLWHLMLIVTDPPAWDVVHEMVVRAPDEPTARQIACLSHGRETADAWLSEQTSLCIELRCDGAPGVVIVDSFFP